MSEPPPDEPSDRATDPVLRRRAQVERAARLGQRGGYLLFGVAVVAFFVGFVAGFDGTIVTVIVATMALGSILLAPAIVASYAVKAAEREDREMGR